MADVSGDKPLPALRGSTERIDCMTGTEDLHARIALEARGGQLTYFAYYSKWKPRTCSLAFARNASGTKWRLTPDGATRVHTPQGRFRIRTRDDFNGMTFNDLFNLLQIWYMEGKGDSERRGITAYGLGHAITNFDDVRSGDFLSYDALPSGGHSCIFIDWLRDDQNRITGLKYFSSNLGGSRGVGYGSGKFSDLNNGRGIIRKSLRIARVGAIKDYKPFARADIPQRNAYAPTQPERLIYLPAPDAATAPPSGK